MKEFETKEQPQQEQVATIGRGKGNKYKTRMPLKPGLKVFEINYNTGDIFKAKYKVNSVQLNGKKGVEELVENNNCIYLTALTKKQAKQIFDGLVAKAKANRAKKQ
jgi:hypothetical protein